MSNGVAVPLKVKRGANGLVILLYISKTKISILKNHLHVKFNAAQSTISKNEKNLSIYQLTHGGKKYYLYTGEWCPPRM